MAFVKATIEEADAAAFILRVLVDGVRVRVTSHASVPAAAKAFETWLDCQPDRRVSVLEIGEAVFTDVREALRHLRMMALQPDGA